MDNNLFADLLVSAEEMVAIETGQKKPDAANIHSYEVVNVRAIREASGISRDEFAKLVGTSTETIKSWETKRRNPTGPAQILLRLIESNPTQMITMLTNSSLKLSNS